MTSTASDYLADTASTPAERREAIAALIAIALVRCRSGRRPTHWTSKGVAIPAEQSVYAHPSRPSPKSR